MKFSVSNTAIDVAAAKKAVADKSCGALVVFEGWIRDHNEGQAGRTARIRGVPARG